LSDRLKHLEENELIERRQYQSDPDRYEYLLTRKGKDVILVVQALAQVGDKWGITGDAAPPLKFINRNSGRQVKLALVNEKSAEVVRMRDVRPQAGPGADDPNETVSTRVNRDELAERGGREPKPVGEILKLAWSRASRAAEI
jgi:DNA-binding MarR family transcriptional regulator